MHPKRNDMSMQNTLFNVVVRDRLSDRAIPTLISASTPEEASDQACLNYVQSHMSHGSPATVRKLIANGTLSAEVTEIGGKVDHEFDVIGSKAFQPSNLFLYAISWAAIVAILYWLGVFDWFSQTS